MSNLDTVLPDKVVLNPNEVVKTDQVSFVHTPEDEAALRIVVQDMGAAQRYLLRKMYVLQWDAAERLYEGKTPIKFWDDNKTKPRAHLSIPLVRTHVESLMPQLMQAIWYDDPPFMVMPSPGMAQGTADAKMAVMNWMLRASNAKEELRKTIKSMVLYGTGICKYGWENYKYDTKKYRRKGKPLTVSTPGMPALKVRTADSEKMEAYWKEVEINQAFVEHVNNRHIVVDPSLRCPDIRKARFVAHKEYPTFRDLQKLRDDPRYKNIPSDEDLKKLAEAPAESPVVDPMEMSTGGISLATEFRALPRFQNPSADPLEGRLLMVEYWTPTRVTTVLQEKIVIRNEEHSYGEVPFLSCVWQDMPDAFYGLGVAYAIGGEQQFQAHVTNNYADVLTLALNPLWGKKRGTAIAGGQSVSMSPGKFLEMSAKDDLWPLNPLKPAPETLEALERSDLRAERATAATEMVIQGTMGNQRSSITRTAAGVNTLASGSGARLQYVVEHFSGQVYEPLLMAFDAMSKDEIEPPQLREILSEELQQAWEDDTDDLYNATPAYRVLSGSKLEKRRQMAQAVPILFQFLGDQTGAHLADLGWKVNYKGLVNVLMDSTGYGTQIGIIDRMTPQEQQQHQAANNPNAAKMALQQQKADLDLRNKKEVISDENTTLAGRRVVEATIRHEEENPLEEGQPSTKGFGDSLGQPGQ